MVELILTFVLGAFVVIAFFMKDRQISDFIYGMSIMLIWLYLMVMVV